MHKLSLFFVILICIFLCTSNTSADLTTFTSFPASFDTDDRSADDMDTIMFSSTTPGDYLGVIDTIPLGGADTLFDSSFVINCPVGLISIQGKYNDPLSDVLVLITNDSVKFGQDEADGVTAITIGGSNMGDSPDGSPHDIEIRGGYTLDAIGDTIFGCLYHDVEDTTVMGIAGVSLIRNVYDVTIRNLNVEIPKGFTWDDMVGLPRNAVGGGQTRLIVGGDENSYNHHIVGGVLRYSQTSSMNRCLYDNCAVEFEDLRAEDTLNVGFEYHVKMDSVQLYSSGQGVTVHGRHVTGDRFAVAIIVDNYIEIDARSDTLWTTDIYSLTGGGEPCVSKGNAYGVLWRNGGYGEVCRNIIRSGTSWGGGRGIMIERTGTNNPNTPVLVDSNDVRVHEGYDMQYGDLDVHGLRIRYGDGEYNKKYRKVRWNYFETTTDDIFPDIVDPMDSGKDYRGLNSVNFRYGDDLAEDRGDSVYENTFVSYAVDNEEATNNVSVMFEDVTDCADVYFAFNRIEGDCILFEVGGYNTTEDVDTAIYSVQDTFVRNDDYLSDFAPIYLGYLYNDWRAKDIKFTDPTFLNGALDKDVTFSPADEADREATYVRNVDIYVKGHDALPVEACSVFVWNDAVDTSDHDDVIAKGITDAAGLFEFEMTYYYTSDYFESVTEVDSSDVIIAAIYDGDKTATTKTVGSTAAGGTETIVLTETPSATSPPEVPGPGYRKWKIRWN